MRDRREVTPWYLACGNRTLEYLKLHSSCRPLIVQRARSDSECFIAETDSSFTDVTKTLATAEYFVGARSGLMGLHFLLKLSSDYQCTLPRRRG